MVYRLRWSWIYSAILKNSWGLKKPDDYEVMDANQLNCGDLLYVYQHFKLHTSDIHSFCQVYLHKTGEGRTGKKSIKSPLL
jgi:hypothetical protein